MPHKIKILLYPIAMIYGLVMRLRNHLYNTGHKKEISFNVMTIGVGNLAMGGTGKTPLTEYLIKTLKHKYKIAVLSRGYGRSLSGIRMADKDATVRTIGDEPMQVFRKFGDEVVVAVGENRLLAIPQILQENPDINLVILDDIYQHRKVKPALNLLLTSYSSPFYFDFIFPAGWLREPRHSARRADAVIVTKCPPGMEDGEMQKIKKSIAVYSSAPVLFSSLQYGKPLPFGSAAETGDCVVLISAIANNSLFVDHCFSQHKVVRHFAFEDHHFYSEREVRSIIEFAKKSGASLLTTEKDMVKLIEYRTVIENSPWFYLPVDTYFMKDEGILHGMILKKYSTLNSHQN